MTVTLIIINVGIYLLQALFFNSNLQQIRILQWLALSADGVAHGYVWQLLTFQFLHDQPWPWHVLFNCLALYFFGREVENALGRKTFTKVYFLAGFLGGLLHLILAWLIPARDIPVVGASAGVAGVIAAYAVLFPERQITLLLFFILPVTLKARYLLWGSAVLSLVGTAYPSGNVAHDAHLGGIIAGFCYLRWGMQAESLWFSRRSRKPRMRTRELVKVPSGPAWSKTKDAQIEELPRQEFISREVDPILDKISAHGIQSLTEQERRILEAARARIEGR